MTDTRIMLASDPLKVPAIKAVDLAMCLPVVEPPYVGSPLDCGTPIEAHGPRGLIMRGNVGGWPYGEEDEPFLCWAPIPCPELILKGEDNDAE